MLDAGPDWIAPVQLEPRVVRPGDFLALAAPFVTFVQGADGALANHVATFAPVAGLDIDPAFAGVHASAIGALDSLGLASDDATIVGVLGANAAITGDVNAHAASLPGPNQAAPDGALPATIDPEPPATQWPTIGDTGVHLPPPLPSLAGKEEEARAAVRSAYLDYLHREPDQAGWDGYVGAIVRGEHDIGWVIRAIQQSDEYWHITH
jgi:hypothetical protein